jgi:3-oxoacyl-[acyl-carrier-protein] synthase-3
MRFGSVCLEAIGYCLPEEILTSAQLEHDLAEAFSSLGFAPGRLEQLTGVRERRLWPVGTRPSSLAAQAGREVLAKTALDPRKIDLLIHTGVCRDALEPATAAVVHQLLGLDPHCQAFDLSNACLGFLNGLITAASLIEVGQIEYALVVSGENAGPIYTDTIAHLKQNPTADEVRSNLASLTLGSAGIALLLCHQRHSRSGHRLLGGMFQIDSSGSSLCTGYGDIFHQRMRTDTAEMMRQGLALSQITWELFKRELSWQQDTPDYVLNHQVSRVHQEKAFMALGLPEEKTYSNLYRYGNTGSVAVPLELALGWEQGLFKPKDRIALLGIGSGLGCLMLGLEW